MEEKVKEIYESNMDFDSLNEEQEVVLSEEDVYFSGDIKVVASDNPYVLGKLVGTFMEIENDNGNGRWYPTETIKTRIVELPYTKRMMEHKSLLGEAHHPLERTNIWMDESAISTTKLTISPDGKKLYGEADILDTPKGQIVNTLARYGTDIGVSARATGKGTKRDGHLVITPDKYFFKTFDAVLNPGFETARPSKKESDGSPMKVYEENEGLPTLYEELKSQIEQNKCDQKMLEYYINYSGDESLKELQLLFEDAATDSVLEDKGDDVMTEAEVKELQEQISELNEENARLQSRVQNLTTDLEVLQEERNNYSERLDYVNEDSSNLKSSAEVQVNELLDILGQQKETISKLNEELDDLRLRYAGLSSTLLGMNEEQKEKEFDNLLLESKLESLEDDVISLYEQKSESKLTTEQTHTEESIVEEESDGVVVPREKVIPDKVDLFEESIEAVNEEQKETKVKPRVKTQSDSRVSLIKSVGGK